MIGKATMTRPALALFGAFGLSACMGGGGGSPAAVDPTPVQTGTYTELSNAASPEQTALNVFLITNEGSASSGAVGTLDHDTATVTDGDFAGTVDAGFATLTLDAGGQVNLSNPGGTEFARFATVEGSGAPRSGVIGQLTLAEDLPASGSSSYNTGAVLLEVADGATLSSLRGNASVTASWNSNRVTSTFSGFRDQTSNAAVSGSLTITGSAISGNSFSGGTASTTGDLFDLSGQQSLTGTQGGFFGPGGDEVGGTVVVDDTANGSLMVTGVFAAD